MNYKTFWLLGLIFVLIATVAVLAQAPPTSQVIPFSATIPGQADGSVNLRLRLFSASTQGDLVFEESQTAVVSSQRFSVYIGNGTDGGIDPQIFVDYPSLWVAFALDATPDAESGSRTPITAAGYALRATSAGNADTALRATSAATADTALRATSAATADTAQRATSAQTAQSANTAERANSARTADTLNAGASISGSQSGPILNIINTARDTPGAKIDQSHGDVADDVTILAQISGIQSTVRGGSAAALIGKNEGQPPFECGIGVLGTSVCEVGVWGEGYTGVRGVSTATSGSFSGVFGSSASTSGRGVYGVAGASPNAFGVYGYASRGTGVYGNGEVIGVRGESYDPGGLGVVGSSPGLFSARFETSSQDASVVVFRNGPANASWEYGVSGPTGAFAGTVPASTMYLYRQGLPGPPFVLSPSGNVGIGTSTPAEKLDVNGTVKAKVVQITGADFSEKFEIRRTQQKIEPGLVVAIDPENAGKLVISAQAYNRRVAGIISGAGGINTGMLMGQPGTLADGDHPVALGGRVYVWADATHAPIAPGDLLTTSNTPGHAMKVTNYNQAQGAILGKAMTGLKEGRGLVLVLVTLQ